MLANKFIKEKVFLKRVFLIFKLNELECVGSLYLFAIIHLFITWTGMHSVLYLSILFYFLQDELDWYVDLKNMITKVMFDILFYFIFLLRMFYSPVNIFFL